MQHVTQIDMHSKVWKLLLVLLLLRRMCPGHNEGRRTELAKTIKARYQNCKNVVFVDAVE